MTFASGGYCYNPTTINEGLSLFESETIISVLQRGAMDWFKIQEASENLLDFEKKPFDTEPPKYVSNFDYFSNLGDSKLFKRIAKEIQNIRRR